LTRTHLPSSLPERQPQPASKSKPANKPDLDFEINSLARHHKRRKWWRSVKIITGAIFTVGFVILLTKVVLFFRTFTHDTGLTPVTIFNLLVDNGVNLAAHNGRTNMLILGIGGNGHTASDLTDTMIVLSVDKRTGSLAMITLPRDLWSDTLKDKINSAYHYGEAQKAGGGRVLAKSIAAEVTGLPIHYSLVIDFDGFKKIIDLVGGIDIMVSEEFTDTQYPVEGRENDDCDGDPILACRFKTIHFNSGLEHMDGTVALMYVRSRHATGSEGSDFARGKRQQDVLLALKQKLVNPKFWLDTNRTRNLVVAFGEAVQTDMNLGELATAVKILNNIDNNSIMKITIENELYEPTRYLYAGRYVLIPKKDLESIHTVIEQQLNTLQ